MCNMGILSYWAQALEVPGCHRRLTFDFGRLEKLPFFISLISAGDPGFNGLEPFGLSKFFLDHNLGAHKFLVMSDFGLQ